MLDRVPADQPVVRAGTRVSDASMQVFEYAVAIIAILAALLLAFLR